MPSPIAGTSINRPDLAELVMEYRDTEVSAGIASQVMPVYPVANQAAGFPVIPKEALLKIYNTQRAMRGTYPRSDWSFEMGKYFTQENGWEEAIDDRERKLYANLFDAEAVATMRATKIIDLGREQRVANKVFNTTNFSANALTTAWSDTASTPIDDVNAGAAAIRLQCGMLPNALIIAYSTFLNLKSNEQIIDRLAYTFPGIELNRMTSADLAKIFNVEKVLIGGAVYDSADKGQDASIADLWTNTLAMLTITSNSPDITSPCIGRTFLWNEENAGTEPVVESYREEGKRGDVVRVRFDSDERLLQSFDDSDTVESNISAAVSYLFSNVTA
jgi:hypothetical protein